MDFVQDNACVSVDFPSFLCISKNSLFKNNFAIETKKLQTPQTHMSYSSRTGTS